jgi:hypothetical protein
MAHKFLSDITIKGLDPLEDVMPFSRAGVLTVATGSAPFRWPFPGVIIGISVAVGTAPTGASLVIDVNKNGTTVFTTQGNRPTIVAGATATASEAIPDVTTIAMGDVYKIDVDQIGSTVAGSDLQVNIRYRRI